MEYQVQFQPFTDTVAAGNVISFTDGSFVKIPRELSSYHKITRLSVYRYGDIPAGLVFSVYIPSGSLLTTITSEEINNFPENTWSYISIPNYFTSSGATGSISGGSSGVTDEQSVS